MRVRFGARFYWQMTYVICTSSRSVYVIRLSSGSMYIIHTSSAFHLPVKSNPKSHSCIIHMSSAWPVPRQKLTKSQINQTNLLVDLALAPETSKRYKFALLCQMSSSRAPDDTSSGRGVDDTSSGRCG